MTIREYGKMVGKCGGNSSQDCRLLNPRSEEDFLRMGDNYINVKCNLTPYNVMKADTWCKWVLLLHEEKLMKLVDMETSSGNL